MYDTLSVEKDNVPGRYNTNTNKIRESIDTQNRASFIETEPHLISLNKLYVL